MEKIYWVTTNGRDMFIVTTLDLETTSKAFRDEGMELFGWLQVPYLPKGENKVVYLTDKGIKGNTCECWVSDYAFPSKDQCELVGKSYELVTVAKCDNQGEAR